MDLTNEQQKFIRELFDSAWTWHFLNYAWVANRFNEKFGTKLSREQIIKEHKEMISAG